MNAILCYKIDDEVTSLLKEYVKNTLSMKYQRNDNVALVSKQTFLNSTIPEYDVPIDNSIGYHIATAINYDQNNILAKCKKILNANYITNHYYMGGNKCMSWHTNSDSPGKRIYYTFTAGEAIFRYKNISTGKIENSYDIAGSWTRREFEIPKNNFLWHTIWTEKPRFSFGFKL